MRRARPARRVCRYQRQCIVYGVCARDAGTTHRSACVPPSLLEARRAGRVVYRGNAPGCAAGATGWSMAVSSHSSSSTNATIASRWVLNPNCAPRTARPRQRDHVVLAFPSRSVRTREPCGREIAVNFTPSPQAWSRIAPTHSAETG